MHLRNKWFRYNNYRKNDGLKSISYNGKKNIGKNFINKKLNNCNNNNKNNKIRNIQIILIE